MSSFAHYILLPVTTPSPTLLASFRGHQKTCLCLEALEWSAQPQVRVKPNFLGNISQETSSTQTSISIAKQGYRCGAWGVGGRLEGNRSLGPPALQPRGGTFAGGQDKCRFKQRLREGKGTYGAPTSVSDMHPAPSEESRGTLRDPGPVFSNLSWRACSAALLLFGTSGSQWAARVLGARLGMRPRAPSDPSPLPPFSPRERRFPQTGAGLGVSRTQGAATAPFVGFCWKFHTEVPLPALRTWRSSRSIQR